MQWIDRLAARMGFARAGRQPQRVLVRQFEGAQVSDLTLSFRPSNCAIDQDLVGQLEMLRGRSRTLAQNNDYARKFLRMVKTNVVGAEGFKLQCLAADPGTGAADTFARSTIEAAWSDWGRPGVCELSGRLSWLDLLRVVAETVARDGECLLRVARGRNVNAHGYALQLLDIDRLPVTHNGRAENGNRIIMGIEVDAFDRPVAYYLYTVHPNGSPGHNSGSRALERVPAADIIHLYTTERAEQHRGVPWMHTAMLRLESLGKFERAALTAARKGANTLGFFQTPDGGPPPGEEKDADGNEIHTSVEGEFDTLPPGYQFQPFASEYPSQMYGDFVKACLRSLAGGLGVAYNGLANDLEGVNFSSIRAGVLEERDVWMTVQTWMVEHLLTPVFMGWLEMALLSGALGTLPPSKLAKFAQHRFQPRRWPWVDPVKDIEAKLMAIRAGLDSRRSVAAEQGNDWDEIVEQLKVEQQQLAEAGVTSDLGSTAAAAAQPAQQAAAAARAEARESTLIDTLRSLAERTPTITVHPPDIVVQAPVVNIEQARAPDVVVNLPTPQPFEELIEHDSQGRIQRIARRELNS